jgi:threonine aldolase
VKKNFYSDNVSGAAPEVLRAIVDSNADDTAPYGGDPYTQRLERRMAEFFGTEVDVYPVGTGTVANGLSASILATPYGGIYCADISHLHVSECGGTEFWSGGNARSVPVPTVDGRIPTATLVEAIEAGALRAADVPGRALSLTQATEAGTVYSLHEVRELAAAAHARNLLVHMDGARFANAVARLGCTPAELTWEAGVDLLSFGATKNGALCAEAVVFFNRKLA